MPKEISPSGSSLVIGVNAIMYQGIQRTFRNAVVAFVRSGLSAQFPADHASRLKRIFGPQWDKMQSNADESRKNGGTFITPLDEYDLLDVNCLFQIFDTHFEHLFPKGATRPSKPKILGNLKQITDSRNPLSHPVEQEIPPDEAISVLMDAKQVLHMLGTQQAELEISKLINQIQDQPGVGKDQRSSALTVLPTQDSVYLEFVGRNAILKDLRDWYSDQNNRRGLLEGAGGKGKSAIAYRFAQDIAESSEEYKLVGWISAKKRKFQSGRIVGIDLPEFIDLESAVNRLLIQYGMLDSDLDLPLKNKKHMLLDLMDEYRSLIIADDFDSVLEDQAVANFLTFEVPHTKSAVLLTSRVSVPGIKNFVVGGFSPPEADIFIANRTRLYSIDPKSLSSQSVRRIREVTDSSPLYIDDLMRLASATGVVKAIEMWSAKQGEAARKYALEQELNKLGADARKLLIAACVSEHPVSFAELQDICDLSDERLSDGLRSLQVLFLLPTPTVIEGDERYAINENTRRLVFAVESATDAFKRIEGKTKALQGTLPRAGRPVISAQIRQAYLRAELGRFSDAEELIKSAIDKYPNEGDLYGFLGFLYKRQHKVNDARESFKKCAKLKGQNADSYRHWVKLEMSEQEWTYAIDAADQALKLLPDLYDVKQQRAEAKCRLAIDLKRRVQDEKADKLFRETIEELRYTLRSPDLLRAGERAISSEMYRTLTICHDWLKDIQGLNHWFMQWKLEHPGDATMLSQGEIFSHKYLGRFRG